MRRRLPWQCPFKIYENGQLQIKIKNKLKVSKTLLIQCATKAKELDYDYFGIEYYEAC